MIGGVRYKLPLWHAVSLFYYCEGVDPVRVLGHNSAVCGLLKLCHIPKWSGESDEPANGCHNGVNRRKTYYRYGFMKKKLKLIWEKFHKSIFFGFFKGPTPKWTAEIDFLDNSALVNCFLSSYWSMIYGLRDKIPNQLFLLLRIGFRNGQRASYSKAPTIRLDKCKSSPSNMSF